MKPLKDIYGDEHLISDDSFSEAMMDEIMHPNFKLFGMSTTAILRLKMHYDMLAGTYPMTPESVDEAFRK